jgi:hypothetical protein
MMSTRTSPIKIRDKPHSKEDFPNLSLGAFRWVREQFVNISTGEMGVKVEVWRICGSANLHGIMVTGRKRMLARMKWVDVYGVEALALALCGVYPCSNEQAKELIKKAKSMNLKFALVCLKSDLYPTDIETFKKMGLKNEWVVVKDYPSRDDINKKLNAQLKKAGSPLRIRSGLRTVLMD